MVVLSISLNLSRNRRFRALVSAIRLTWLRTVSKMFACKFGRRSVRLVAAKVCAGLSCLQAIEFLCDRQQPRSQRGINQQLERNADGGRQAPYEIQKAVPEP